MTDVSLAVNDPTGNSYSKIDIIAQMSSEELHQRYPIDPLGGHRLETSFVDSRAPFCVLSDLLAYIHHRDQYAYERCISLYSLCFEHT